MTILPPQYIQGLGYSARNDRQLIESHVDGEGVAGPGDFRVSAGSGMSVNVAAGEAFIRGDSVSDQGIYHIKSDAITPKTISPAHASSPRLDQIILRVFDSTESGGPSNLGSIEVLTGLATTGATLDNRSGFAPLPPNAILLADIRVPSAAGALGPNDILSRRQFVFPGNIPPTKTVVDMAAFEPVGALAAGDHGTQGNHAQKQSYALMHLKRRIVNATRIRWRYIQTKANGETGVIGNYNIGIYDASGRKIVETGSIAFIGAASLVAIRSETISATTFEAGLYYIGIGVSMTGPSGGVACYYGVPTWIGGDVIFSYFSSVSIPNVVFASSSGGVTLPLRINAYDDVGVYPSTSVWPTIPIVALSVG